MTAEWTRIFMASPLVMFIIYQFYPDFFWSRNIFFNEKVFMSIDAKNEAKKLSEELVHKN